MNFKKQKSYEQGLTKNNADYFTNLKGGRYHKVKAHKIIELPKKLNSTDLVEKNTTIVGRLKVDWRKTSYAKNQPQPITSKTNNYVAVVKDLIYFNTNTNKYYLRVIGTKNQYLKVKTTYRLNKKKIAKQDLIDKGYIKEQAFTDNGILNFGLETITSIK